MSASAVGRFIHVRVFRIGYTELGTWEVAGPFQFLCRRICGSVFPWALRFEELASSQLMNQPPLTLMVCPFI